MPEGDTVHVTAARLHGALSGRVLERVDVRVPRHAEARLGGRRIDEVVARGKHILVRFDGGVTLHSHLGMHGAWHLYRPGSRWRGPGHEVRAVLEAAERVAVGFRLVTVELIATDREADVLGHLGPDVLGPEWDPARAVALLSERAASTIGDALLDQRALAGVGNVYKSEVLWLAGIDPFTPVSEVDDLFGVVATVKRVMEANRSGGRQVVTGDPRSPHYVYGRAGLPCRRCGAPIRTRRSGRGERVTYWCPRCQRRPGT